AGVQPSQGFSDSRSKLFVGLGSPAQFLDSDVLGRQAMCFDEGVKFRLTYASTHASDEFLRLGLGGEVHGISDGAVGLSAEQSFRLGADGAAVWLLLHHKDEIATRTSRTDFEMLVHGMIVDAFAYTLGVVADGKPAVVFDLSAADAAMSNAHDFILRCLPAGRR